MSESVNKNKNRRGWGRGHQGGGSRAYGGASRWRCPNPDCEKWCSGKASDCPNCNTSRQVAKDLDKMLAKREADRNADRREERMRSGDVSNKRGGYNRNRYDDKSRGRRNKDQNRRRNKGRGQEKENSDSHKEKDENDGPLTEEDKILDAFDKFRDELDIRHDKMERIVKLSRDITIESKRIIFHLHRIQHETDKESIIEDVEKRLRDVKINLWSRVAKELKHEEDYQFVRKYSDGLQEWIEALSFYHYIHSKRLISWQEVQQQLVFTNSKSKPKTECSNENVATKDLAKSTEQIDLNSDVKKEGKEDEKKGNVSADAKESAEKGMESNDVSKESTKESEESNKDVPEESAEVKAERTENIKEEVDDAEEFEDMKIEVPPTEYVLGLADLTGELMRNAINSLSCGDMDVCFTLLAFLQKMHSGFQEVEQNCPRVVLKKLYTLKQSMIKVENACYQITVRGSEIPENHLADIFHDKKYESGYEDAEA